MRSSARPQIDAIIFDLDGVLTDTAAFHEAGWQRLAEEQGWKFDSTLADALRGVSRMASLERILEHNGVEASEADKQEWADRKNAYYVQALEDVSPDDALPGALELVLAAKEVGLAVAIGSSSRNARTVLERLDMLELFDAISDGNSVERAKPAPDLFVHAAQQLGVEPARAAVVEDAESGVDAALAGGMIAVGVGPAERLGHAHHRWDTVAELDLASLVHPHGPVEQHLENNVITASGWIVRERVWEPGQLLTTGSNYLIGNGYLGYRGSFPEWTAEQHTGCIVSDTYDCADGHWTELCNAPNALFSQVSVAGEPAVMLPGHTDDVAEYQRELVARYGVHRRSWLARGPRAVQARLLDERFASADDLHVVPMRQVIEVDEPAQVTVRTGIDGIVWDLNGDHYRDMASERDGDELVMTAWTTEHGLELVVAQALAVVAGPAPQAETDHREHRRHLRELTFHLEPDQPLELEIVMAVWSGNDVAAPREAALASARAVRDSGYQRAKARHVVRWDERWRRLDVQVDGDPATQAMLRYNLYQAVIATPTHTDHLPIGARGLSCQAYQGGAFWDQEIFNLPMWLHTDPAQARDLLAYRHRTLDGARRKAANLGFEGAFYAWVTGLTGDELCPSYFFTDVNTGRSFKNHFNDWQIHISPDVAYAVQHYERATGDWDFMVDHGAEILCEVARFIRSRVHWRVDRQRYEIVRVLGPDEYHEGVDNSAFTNWMCVDALAGALDVRERLAAHAPSALAALDERLGVTEREVADWRHVADHLHRPAPDPTSGVIEQFDGYFGLEDTTPEVLRGRLLDPSEYWGWPSGVAVETQVLKQADIVQLALLQPELFTDEQVAANYDYYEPRTQHGSSLSPPTHATVAVARLGRVDEALRMFVRTLGTDLFTRASKVSGGTFIGGIHTAAAGASWDVVARGFCGLRAGTDEVGLAPRLPAHWERLSLPLVWRGRRLHVTARPKAVTVVADAANTEPLPLRLWDEAITLDPGAQVQRQTG